MSPGSRGAFQAAQQEARRLRDEAVRQSAEAELAARQAALGLWLGLWLWLGLGLGFGLGLGLGIGSNPNPSPNEAADEHG